MSTQRQSDRPNIVIIMSDQHNAHVMGCAGDTLVRTPNLDALAREGVRCTAAYCPYPLCVPARMGFMTAQMPSRVNVWDNGSVLSSDVPTFAHALGAAGYETTLCGRMHFSGPDQFHGFERRIYGDCFRFLGAEIEGAGYNRTDGQTQYAVEVAGHGRTGYQAYDRLVTQHACEFIGARAPGARPYCLVVGYILPHNPLICERELFEFYLDTLPVPAPISEQERAALNPAIRAWRERRGVDDLTPAQNHRALAAYYGLVTELDRNIGRVVEAVRRSAHADTTALLYCTDHGDMACEHGMWWKSCHFEGSARVPLIAAWPGRFAQGRTVGSLVSLTDIGPTALDLAGADPLPDVEGRSLAAFLTGGRSPPDWPDEIFCEYIGAHGDQPSCMVRSGPWKLMYYAEFDSYLLFNLAEDPGETRDRAHDPACRDLADTLLKKIHARWSARAMLDGYARERRARAVIGACGHPPIPCLVEPPGPPDDAEHFDFSQVPHWDAIRKRVAGRSR
ncbi:MAG: sulfatase-like hydrolase/transferase [Kiritimatiellae bacterium]|nr:sulfatase-like hydrolase/transferase [Kiritimatiellia bacterium]